MWITSPATVPNRAGVPTDICGGGTLPACVFGCFSPPQTPAFFQTHLCKCNYSFLLIQANLHTLGSWISTESLMSLFILWALQSRTCSVIDSQVEITLCLPFVSVRNTELCTLLSSTRRTLNCSSRIILKKVQFCKLCTGQNQSTKAASGHRKQNWPIVLFCRWSTHASNCHSAE